MANRRVWLDQCAFWNLIVILSNAVLLITDSKRQIIATHHQESQENYRPPTDAALGLLQESEGEHP